MKIPKGVSTPEVLKEEMHIYLRDKFIQLPPGTMVWKRRGLIDNKFGPAIILPSGKRYFFHKGKSYTAEELFNKLSSKQKKKAAFNLDWWNDSNE